MRECHPSKGGAEDGNHVGVVILWPQVCILLPAAPWGLGPGQSEVSFSAFTLVEPPGMGSSLSPRSPRPESF